MNTIYGFGNALVDIEIRISEIQLQDIEIKKGSMKHIAKEELAMYLETYSKNIHSKLPGGSIANSLYAANKHGAKTHFSCSLGEDEYGQYFIDRFKDEFRTFQLNVAKNNPEFNQDLAKKVINREMFKDATTEQRKLVLDALESAIRNPEDIEPFASGGIAAIMPASMPSMASGTSVRRPVGLLRPTLASVWHWKMAPRA